MQKSANFTIEKTPQVDNLTNEEWSELIQKSVSDKQRQIQIKMNEKGRSFMGVKAVLQQKATGTESKLMRLKSSIAAYKEAFNKWQKGDRDAVFPPGTYYLRIHVKVKCAPG